MKLTINIALPDDVEFFSGRKEFILTTDVTENVLSFKDLPPLNFIQLITNVLFGLVDEAHRCMCLELITGKDLDALQGGYVRSTYVDSEGQLQAETDADFRSRIMNGLKGK
jgi:hypothetical protein